MISWIWQLDLCFGRCVVGEDEGVWLPKLGVELSFVDQELVELSQTPLNLLASAVYNEPFLVCLPVQLVMNLSAALILRFWVVGSETDSLLAR